MKGGRSSKSSKTRGSGKAVPKSKPVSPRLVTVEAQELNRLRTELSRLEKAPRWNPNEDEVRRSVAKLVLTLVDFIRKLLERQAIRRMENETLSPKETEDIGKALMQLEETIEELCHTFGLTTDELNLDLGPIGRLK